MSNVSPWDYAISDDEKSRYAMGFVEFQEMLWINS
jgi:hypothetical protein